MRDVTSYVGEIIPTQEAEQLLTRANALGWQLRTQPAGHDQVRIMAILAPAVPEDEPANNEELSSLLTAVPATDSGLPRSERVLTADCIQPAFAMAG